MTRIPAITSGRPLAFGRWLVVCIAAVVLVGCGRRDLHPVSGTVRFPDGAPLTTGRVVAVYPPPAAYGGWGYIKHDGTFTLGSFTPTDGVRAGTVQVAITFAYDDDGVGNPKPLVHKRFESPDTSGLSFEIPRQTTWDIVVERP
jgi:hypothetical protein